MYIQIIMPYIFDCLFNTNSEIRRVFFTSCQALLRYNVVIINGIICIVKFLNLGRGFYKKEKSQSSKLGLLP